MMPKVEYTAMLLGATGNVGGHILHLLMQRPLCKKVVVVTRRNVAELANRKVQQVVVNMDKLEKELAPHAKGVDIALRTTCTRSILSILSANPRSLDPASPPSGPQVAYFLSGAPTKSRRSRSEWACNLRNVRNLLCRHNHDRQRSIVDVAHR